MFKNFNQELFKAEVGSMPELAKCLAATCAERAANFLSKGIARILDDAAPVRNIQNRKDYVPYLTAETKDLQAAAQNAQKTAVQTGGIEDWRLYRSLRNQKNRAVK